MCLGYHEAKHRGHHINQGTPTQTNDTIANKGHHSRQWTQQQTRDTTANKGHHGKQGTP